MKNLSVSKSTKSVFVGQSSAVAAGSGDNTAVVSATIDRAGYTNTYDSAVLNLAYLTTLTADKTLSFTVSYTHSDDDSTYSSAVTLQAATVARTGAVTAGTGLVTIPFNMEGIKRYVKISVTPDLSHSGTDTATWMGTLVMGSADYKPTV
jgi:hypothetical protein